MADAGKSGNAHVAMVSDVDKNGNATGIEATGHQIRHESFSTFSRAVQQQKKTITSVGEDNQDNNAPVPIDTVDDQATFYDPSQSQ